MSSPIKLISTDFDGTIFAEFEKPPIATSLVRLIEELQAQGVKWVINTGRDMSGLMEALARARISVQPDALVLVEREIYYHDRASYIAHEAWNRHCAADHAELFIRVRPHLPELVGWVNGHFTATVYEDPWSPFCLIAGNNADADAIHARMEDLCRTVPQLTVVRNDVYARFAHSSYDKGKGLAEIARRWNIATDNIFAAGDHLNDLPMLDPQYARWLATPANGIACVKERVRQHGGFVSRRYEGNGIADALEAILYAPPAPPA